MYKTIEIQNRRYLGNKFRLLPTIKKVVDENCHGIEVVADLFAGTGVVASAFQDKILITNDILYSNYIVHLAWFGSMDYDEGKVVGMIEAFNENKVEEDNYMSECFSNTFFSIDDCRKIGAIREEIENRYGSGDLNVRERALLITSLLYAMDRIAKTCGHYDAYRHNVEYDAHLEMFVPNVRKNNRVENQIYNCDVNEIASKIKADLVYLDPPYNSRQYCDAYHLLENVSRWEKPKVAGVARKMDRSGLKSDYCVRKASKSFEQLVKNIRAKYILLSYNNMKQKGNDRSNAKISDEDIMRILQDKGEVKIFSQSYKAFSTGLSSIQDNEERLFLCECG